MEGSGFGGKGGVGGIHHHISVSNSVGLDEQLVGKRALAVINVSYDGEIPDHVGWHLINEQP